MFITAVINLLKNYTGPFELTLKSGASEELIAEVEQTYGIVLPDDFKTFYRFTNGFEMDEDMFNMISLTDLVSEKSTYNLPLCIAEYMIYSDTWELKINQHNSNDYQIINRDHDGDELVLTNSLAEFIIRFLRGGVFDSGGLYDWHEEIRAKNPYDPKYLKPVLTVFSRGLANGIISREQVIAWADNIIMLASQPDNFFIEISLSHDLNELITAISSVTISDTRLSTRALFGILYQLVLNETIAVDKAFVVMDNSIFFNQLTLAETNNMLDIEYSFFMDGEEFNNVEAKKAMLAFLIDYKDFTLNNYDKWVAINQEVENKLAPKNAELRRINNQMHVDNLNKIIASNKRSKTTNLITLAILFVVIGFTIIKFNPQSITTFAIVFCVLITRTIIDYKSK